MKFLCDQMLGTLATWLRLFGFDTFYANSEIDDDELLDITKKENRTLVTRDKELTIRASKRKLQYIEINSTEDSSSSYSSELLRFISSFDNIPENKLSFSGDQPLRLEYNFDIESKLSFILAPIYEE